METKPLLYGLIGFFLGGLLVSVAATTFDKPEMENMPELCVRRSVEAEADERLLMRGRSVSRES